MKIFIIINLFISLSFANDKELDGAINYIKGIITKKENSSLKVKGCDVDKANWMNLLVTKTSFEEKISFNKNCHIEGTFKPKMNVFFEVPLKIKDKRFKEIKYSSKIEIVFNKEMNLILTIKDGQLIDLNKKIFKFSASQIFKMDPFNKKNPISKSKNGTLNVQYQKTKRTIKL